MASDEAKRYFREPGTVARWWNPEDERDAHFTHFREQLHWTLARFEWVGAKVLDMGAGKGRFAIPYALASANVMAVDISAEMLAETRRRAQRAGAELQLVQADAEQLPFRADSFDIVSCMEMLMHVPRPGQAVQEAARVMRRPGSGVFSITNKWRINAVANLPVRVIRFLGLNRSAAGPQIAWYYSLGTFRRFLRDAGLDICTLQGQGLFQPGARLRITRRLTVPLIPERFARWFFLHVEPGLRQGPLVRVMGTLQATVVPESE